MKVQPELWKAHTRANIRRIRTIFKQQGPPLKGRTRQGNRNNMYRLALDIVLTELKPSEAFPWGKFQNVLRILVCGASEAYNEAALFVDD